MRLANRCTSPIPAMALLMLVMLCCAGPQALAGQDDGARPPRRVQEIVFRVMDGRDAPVAGAKVVFEKVAGRPSKPGPYRTDAQGELLLRWRPKVTDETAGVATKDTVWRLETTLRYTIEAPGHVAAAGEIKRRDRDQIMATPQLQRLSRRAVLSPITETVVMRKFSELLGRGLRRRSKARAVIKSCLDFHRENQAIVRRLGAEFAWPSFSLRAGVLSMALDWRGEAWRGLADAPLPARVALATGVPLAVACGEELLPLAGVKRLRLVFKVREVSKKDPHALPTITRVIIEAPAADYLALAGGKMEPGDFLAKHPPKVVEPAKKGGGHE